MKKKFILLAMMLLTLIGGVKFNVLNAQETITIGSGTDAFTMLPSYTYYNYSVTQQIYTADEIVIDGVNTTGNITSVAFNVKTATSAANAMTRTIDVYLQHTDKVSFTSGTDMVNIDASNLVYTGTISLGSTGWVKLNFQNPFEYNGGNVVLCVNDKSGNYGTAPQFLVYGVTNGRSIFYYKDNAPQYNPASVNNDNQGSYSSKIGTYNGYYCNNQVQFTIEPAVQDDIIPAVPTGLTATAIDHKSISLTWTAGDEYALKYNIYQNGTKIGSTSDSETSYTVEGLTAETDYCFTVEAVRGVNVSETKSNEACATTLEYIDPFDGKQFRIKALTYNTKSPSNVVSGPYSFTSPMYLNISSYNDDDSPYINAVAYAETPEQVFAFEPTGNENEYYLRSASGYYIKCYNWNMGAPSTNVADASPLRVSYIDETTFYLMNGRSSDEYIKVETSTNDYVNYRLYCDFKDQAKAAKWTVEEVLPEAPTAPTLSANAISATAIQLSWDAVFSAETYTVYEGTNVIAENITETEFLHDDLIPSTTYNYTVTATNEIGTSEASNTATATTWAPAPETAPANLQATNVTHNSVTLTWDVVDGATYYEIYKDAVYLDQTNTTTYTATGLNAETSYSFTVKAGNISGISPVSEALSVTTEQFIGRTVVFELNDYYLYYGTAYYDGWNNNKLSVVLSTGEVYEYTNSGSAATEYYYLDVPYGTTVTVTYLNIGSYPYENTYYIRYNDDNSLIYQDGRAVNGGNAPTANSPFSFIVERPAPKNLVANPSQIYPDQTTTLTWEAYEGAASYNIYVNSELKANTTETSYELSGLTYNVNGNTIEVIAVDENGTEISGKASVTVQVAGTFTLTVNVTDGTSPIVGATVNIDMAYAYDEFKNQISPVTVEPTDADGKTTVELPILCQETYFYNNNGTYVSTSYYTVEVSKSPYQDNNWNYINYYEDVTSGYTMDVVLLLPMVDYIQVQDPAGNYLDGDVMEGTNVILSWDAVEGADSYKVYTFVEDVEIKSETTIDPKYFVEGVEKGYEYAVSALFGDLESEKYYANLTVKGIGYFKGYVTDGTNNALEGIQVKVSSEYGDVSAVATTNEEGYFIGEIMEGDNYILTISHSDYDEFISTPFPIVYQTEYDFETIELNAKPSSDVTSVTATVNGDNVDVEWTVEEATKYNVYRRLASAQDCGEMIAEEIEGTTYTDTQWTTVAPGTYQYGVSAFVEPQAQTRGTEVIFEEGFENNGEWPDGWTRYSQNGYNNWLIYNSNSHSDSYCAGIYSYSTSSYERWLRTPEIELNTSSPILRFYFKHTKYQAYSIENKFTVKVKGEDNNWIDVYDNEEFQGEYTLVEVPLEGKYTGNKIQIEFYCYTGYYSYIYIDDISIVSPSSEVETQIVWSDAVVKQGPNTFEGTVSTDWNVAENWSNGVVPAEGDNVTIEANAVITSGNVNVKDLAIYPNVSLTVGEGTSLTVTGLITQKSNYSIVLEEGGQIFQNNNNVTARFKMSIDNPSDWSNTSNTDGWQFISMPLENVPHTDFTSYGEYDLYKYDGSQDLEWQNHKDGGFEEEAFKSGVGYLASLKDAETATVFGTLNTATPFVFSGYNQIIYNEEKDLANFRLFGNPFTYDIYMSDFDLDFYNDGENDFVSGYAVVNNSGSYDYRTIEPIKVGEGFFVKALSSTAIAYAPASKRSENKSNNSLNITATGNAGEDNVIINLAGKSEGFDKLQNFNDAIATVYVAEGGKNYGIYNCDADVQEIELNFNANQMGNYTISIEPNGKFQTVTLVDRFTGVETNMLVEDYNFTAMSGVNNNRFIVKLAVSDQQSAVSDNFVYQSGEDLIIDAEGTVQIIDVMGRVLVSDEVESTNNRINVSGFQNGTYMVRVINGSEVKVEKVVIY